MDKREEKMATATTQHEREAEKPRQGRGEVKPYQTTLQKVSSSRLFSAATAAAAARSSSSCSIIIIIIIMIVLMICEVFPPP